MTGASAWSPRSLAPSLGVLLAFLTLETTAGDALACPAVAAARDAAAMRDASAMAEVARAAAEDPGCAPQVSAVLARNAAILFTTEADAALARADRAAAAAAARRALAMAPFWRAHEIMGDLARDHGDRARALHHYLLAMNDLDAHPDEPGPDALALRALFKKAETQRLLAPDATVTIERSDGTVGGLYAASLRGFVPVEVAIPLRFDTASADLRASDLPHARNLVRMLREQALEAIRLEGHTDARGSDAYNESLSHRRAQTVATFLRDNGYTGRIEVAGLGERQPFEPDQPLDRFTVDEIWQMNRRVELVRLD